MAILPIDGKRYGTPEMRAVFEEQQRIGYQLRIEGAVAASQGELGIIPKQAGRSILAASRSKRITPARIRRLEAKSDHDTAALVEALAAECAAPARPWIHYGLTSNDLVDTCNSMQMRDALDIMRPKIAGLARLLSRRAAMYAETPAVGRTHGQHASIISFGLKFANWASEVATHACRLADMRPRVLLCKTLGVVGTGSLMGSRAVDVQRMVASRLGLYAVRASTQVVPRERYAEYVFALSLLGSTLEKVAVEIRNLQRTEIGEASEIFRKGQMGSSAVPVKRNPTKSERVTSLSRILRAHVPVSLENIPLWHERDLSNSANERFILPTSAILLDEMLGTMTRVIRNLHVDRKRIARNLEATRGQIFAEFVLEALIRKGRPRFEAYRDVQRVAFAARDASMEFREALEADPAVSGLLGPQELGSIFDAKKHLGASRRIIRGVDSYVRRALNSC